MRELLFIIIWQAVLGFLLTLMRKSVIFFRDQFGFSDIYIVQSLETHS